MSSLVWDQVGDRRYQAGIDRGVLYLPDGSAVPWNGLTGMDEESNVETNSFYVDGVKHLDAISPGEFAGTLRAFTYPDELDALVGVRDNGYGVSLYDQPLVPFGLSYRTKIGNDVDGVDHGYKLHILYNIMANPGSKSFATIASESAPMEFTWALTCTPNAAPGVRPTAHISLDSTQMSSSSLAAIEERLYGSASLDPSLPSLSEIFDLSIESAPISVVDNGDGTWTMTAPDDLITLSGDGTFEVQSIDATYLDSDTYEVPTT